RRGWRADRRFPSNAARRSAIFAEVQEWSRWSYRLFDNPGHDEKVVVLGGSVGERLGDGQAGPHLVGAEAVFQVRFAKEGDMRDIDFRELADVAQHIAQLLLERRDFLRGEAESREVGDIRDVDAFGRGIGHKLLRLSEKLARVPPKGIFPWGKKVLRSKKPGAIILRRGFLSGTATCAVPGHGGSS